MASSELGALMAADKVGCAGSLGVSESAALGVPSLGALLKGTLRSIAGVPQRGSIRSRTMGAMKVMCSQCAFVSPPLYAQTWKPFCSARLVNAKGNSDSGAGVRGTPSWLNTKSAVRFVDG